MIVKRKLFSFIDEDGNLGYYLYNEATGEEKLFSVVEEEERMYARGTKEAGKLAKEFLSKKGNKAANKAAKREYYKAVGLDQFAKNDRGLINNIRPGSNFEELKVVIGRSSDPASYRVTETGVNAFMDLKKPGNIKTNKDIMKSNKKIKKYRI